MLLNHVNMRLFLAKYPYWQGLPESVHDALVWNGQNGVQIFFALSGYLITSTSLRRWGSLSKIRVAEFYGLRFARIAPLLLLVLGMLSLLHWRAVPGFVVSDDTGGLGRALIAALTFHINLLEARRGYLPGSWDILWSLSVEEVFYLGFPLVCRVAARGKLLIAILLGFVAMGPFARTVWTHGDEVWREVSYLGGMDAIAMGCLTALAASRVQMSRVPCRWLMLLGMAGMAYVLSLSDESLQRLGLDMSLLGLSACLVVLAAAQWPWHGVATDGGGPTRRCLSAMSLPLRWVGRRSYEVYLTHMFVVMSFFGIFAALGMPGGAAVSALFGLVILASALLGGAVARYYSEPMNRLLRRRFGTSRLQSS